VPMRPSLAVVAVLFASASYAEEQCKVEAGPLDIVKRHGDVVVEPGQQVEDAIALDGQVIVKKGASVKSAVSLNGDVVVEAGAQVRKAALALGGVVKAAKGSEVHSRIDISDAGLRLRGEEGDEVSLNFSFGGKSLGQRIVDEATQKVKGCKITRAP
jgi:hypothetical protein